jgi:hypothetical protein
MRAQQFETAGSEDGDAQGAKGDPGARGRWRCGSARCHVKHIGGADDRLEQDAAVRPSRLPVPSRSAKLTNRHDSAQLTAAFSRA